MRISTSQMEHTAISAILDRQSRLSKSEQQLATGKRIITPADDPAGAVKVQDLTQTIQTTEQYQMNINAARQRLGTEENALGSVTNLLQRVRELAVQGNNDVQTSEDRQMIAYEVRERLDELMSLANTRDANGEYVFSGYEGNIQPFTRNADGTFNYNGDQGRRFIQVSPSRQIASTDSGYEVFQTVKNGNGTFTTLDHASNNGSGIIDPGAVTNASLYDGDTYEVVFPVATSATGSLTVNDVVGTDDDLGYTLAINGTTVYTRSESTAGTPPATLNELAAVINDDSSTTSVRAYVSGSTLYLASTSPSVADITVTESLSGSTLADADTITGYFGSSLDASGVATVSNSVVYSAADAIDYVVVDSHNNVEASGAYQAGARIAFNGIETSITGNPQMHDRFTISPSVNQDVFTVINDLIVALESGGTGSEAAGFHNTLNRVLADLGQSEDRILQARAGVGGRLNALDGQESTNADYLLDVRSSLSQVQDLDYAEAISRMNLEMVGLEAAQQAYVKVQGLSLFNYL